MTAKAKTVDKSKIVSSVVRLLKKEFGGLPKRQPASVLETVLFGICLETASYEQAQLAFDRLSRDFFDWNEIRVSTITELLPVFDGLPEPELKAHRIRALLYYVFDHQYSYDFESLKTKPLELAQKQLSKIKHMTPFLRHYLLQFSLGTHTIPCDDRMLEVVVFLGLLPHGANADDAADILKTLVRKPDGPELFWMLKSLSACSKANFFDEFDFENETGMVFENVPERISEILSGKAKRRAARQRVEAAKVAAKANEVAKNEERVAKRKAATQARADAKVQADADALAIAERIAAEEAKAAKAAAAEEKKTVRPVVVEEKKKTARPVVIEEKKTAPKKTVKAPKKAAKKTTKPTAVMSIEKKKAGSRKASKKLAKKKKR